MAEFNILGIVVTYNGEKWIEKCLSSLILNNVKEIIVIDNGSTDKTLEIIKEKFPQIKLILCNENLGFGKANNIGLKYALENKFDYVYLLNQDAWLLPDALNNMIKVIDKDPKIGIISPLQITASQNSLDKVFSYCCPPEMISDSLFNNLKDVYYCEMTMAAHWLITKDCLNKVGGFSPAFPHYGEDNNFGQRAQYKGFKMAICTTASGIHDREFRKNSQEKESYMKRIRFLIDTQNPFLKRGAYRAIKNYTKSLILHPNSLDIKNYKLFLKNFLRNKRIFNKSLKDRAFLN